MKKKKLNENFRIKNKINFTTGNEQQSGDIKESVNLKIDQQTCYNLNNNNKKQN